ncbi:hypothetical protein MT325_m550L [Paramecium bursaria chlorella virus MT325]|uniref:Uncharacterized protein m550L n=1 Tax=Paramecium bursaria Chlorella virus MT325 TaxID=346932 RepID=A7IUT0_PBCVM|nr:hypothetical protein MT325_m550L [Paramecium bursaria chlorella virus MT325]
MLVLGNGGLVREILEEIILPLGVESFPDLEPIENDVERICILLNLAFGVKGMHVSCANGLLKLQDTEIGFSGEVNLKKNILFCVLLAEVHNDLLLDKSLQEILVIRSPRSNGQLRHHNTFPTHLGNTLACKSPIIVLDNGPSKLLVPRSHRHHLLARDETLDIVDDVLGIVRRNVSAEPCPDTIGTIYEQKRNSRNIPFGLNRRTIVLKILKEDIIGLIEHLARHGRQLCKDIPGRSAIFPAKNTRTKLTVGEQQVHVVTAHIVLCHAYNGTLQTLLTMMVSRVLSDVTRKLSDLHFVGQVPLECGKEDLTLRWLEAIHHAGNRTLHVIP